MTTRDMYDALTHVYGYKRDWFEPSTRYDEKYRKSRETYSNACEIYDDVINGMFRKDTEAMDFNNTKIIVDGQMYNAHDIVVTRNYGEPTNLTATAYLTPSYVPTNKINYGGYRTTPAKNPTIENVIFNPPATIVFWSDKSKTIVKADYDYESFDPEKGLAMAITKKLMGDNKGHYYELFKHWRKKWVEQNEAAEDVKIDIPKNSIEKFAESVRSTFNIDDLLP